MLLDNEELVIINLEGSTNSMTFGNTNRSTDNETFAEVMLTFHKEVAISVFNSKAKQVFDLYNDFIDKPEPDTLTSSVTKSDPEIPF